MRTMIVCLMCILVMSLCMVTEAADRCLVTLEWHSGSIATDLDLSIVNPKDEICDYGQQTMNNWGAAHGGDDKGAPYQTSKEMMWVDREKMSCYALGSYKISVKSFKGPAVNVTAKVTCQDTTTASYSGTVPSKAYLPNFSSFDIKVPSLCGNEQFNITYGNQNIDHGYQNGTRTIDLGLGLEESNYGVVTLYRKKIDSTTYNYEFTLSAQGSDYGIRDILFIALVDERDKIVGLPIEEKRRDGSLIFPVVGKGVEVRTEGGSFYSYSKSAVGDGLANALYTIGGFVVGVVDKLNIISGYQTATSLTEQFFSALDKFNGGGGLTAERQRVLPSTQFADDAADFNRFNVYRLSVPVPSSAWEMLMNYAVVNGVRFSIRISQNSQSVSLPRFYLLWENDTEIEEQIALVIGTKRSKDLRMYDRYIGGGTRWIPIYELPIIW